VIRRLARRSDLQVFRIDDRDTRGLEWHVEPGYHRVWVKNMQYGTAMNVQFTAWTYCAVDLEAAAGGDYQILSDSDQRSGGAGDTAVTLGTRVVDADGTTVGEWRECLDHAPRF